jgi:uncharacterized protein YutE (UPF0331/DUF86 family)
MTPTGIRLKVVRERLQLAEECVAQLRELPSASLQQFLSDRRNPLAADALLRRAIEALFDTARHMLAKGFGIGKLEYREIAVQAVELGLIRDAETGRALVEIAGYRNRLIHHYEDVTPEELYGIARHHLGDLEAVAAELRAAAARLAAGGDASAPDAAPS